MIKKLYEMHRSHKIFTFYGPIEEFFDYEELLETLFNAESGDVITLLINSPGGRCDIGDAIVNAMQDSKAAIECIVESPSYSMAALIALCGHQLKLKENSFLMFHDYSTMYYGKGSEIALQSKAERDNFNVIMKKLCTPFLTDKECDKVLNGEDLYIKWNDKDLDKRIKRHFKVSNINE